MSETALAVAGFGVLLMLIAARLHVGLAMMVTGAAGYVWLSSWPAFLAYMKTNSYHQFANYTLSVIPLFILMGALAEESGLSKKLFRAAAHVVGRFRGGLAYAVVASCAGFGAICGSSVATTATFGRAALPELERYRYDGGFATGVIAVGGTLGILVPPSVILVVYAIATEQNIAKLFMAALVPGLLAAIFYSVTIYLVVWRRPDLGPPSPAVDHEGTWRVVAAAWPALAVALVVVGGIYGGVFTPTEGAAVGVAAMFAIGLGQRALGWSELRRALLQTASTTGMIFIILLGSEVFNAFLALSQLPASLSSWIGAMNLPPYAVLAALLACYILLGAVMDELAMLLLTLPVFFPVVAGLDFGLPGEEQAIWFGVLVLVVVGMGLTAPPIGLNVFVVSAIAARTPIAETYRGVLPFLAADIVRLGVLMAFPVLALGMVRWLG
ncbi:MAG: TRAP transporter large permease [Beijerinckiaceae bacterium]